MKNWKRLIALLLSLSLAASLCACGGRDANETASAGVTGGGSSENPEPSLAPAPAPSIEVDLTQNALAFAAGISPDKDLLTVNGTPVKADLTLYWLALSCSNFMSYYGMFGVRLSDELGDGSGNTFADQMMESAVTIAAYNVLLQDKAAELGCLPTDAQAEEAREKMMAEGQERYDTLKTAFGLTDEAMEFLYLSDTYFQNVLDAVYPAATDEMLNNYAYQARHILIKTVDDSQNPLPEDEIAQKKKQAEDILAQLRAADDLEARFVELMNEHSEDGRNEDGALAAPDGYTTARGEMVPEFEEAALALKPGEMSGLVKSVYGYHIILRGEVEDIRSYAEDCRQYYLDQDIDALLDEADVTRDPALEALDVAVFFDRYTAYQNDVVAQNQPAESDSGNDEDSAG